MTTGEKIRYYRNLRGMSQETLGEISGIHYATIKKYELGIRNPKPEQLLNVSDFLKWPAFDLTDCPSIAHFSVRQRFNDTGADAPVQSNHFSR